MYTQHVNIIMTNQCTSVPANQLYTCDHELVLEVVACTLKPSSRNSFQVGVVYSSNNIWCEWFMRV